MDKIERDCIRVTKKKVSPTFFLFIAQNRLVCVVTIILAVKEFHITIVEF